ncbi:hypothetical protein THMIRHAS_14680 [Thiosulfatimonas sediminis]|uniref:Fe/B12 periplasmic-binding domain-containing protein n=1 Tax=Thiosulfatimonas sediminis TaxID=2675054 RepID=A0A6F8PVE6_9GAMM|nr:ABC transporter substrate-binding protein [Thiosulfatimonas sediminis]BBP46095.1 hypothetical protein THMIRHAS_14680 [Thiosulfatimonas sediminis]
MRSLAVLLLAFSLNNAAQADCPRIISQSPYITHQLDYLGLKTCLVGTSRYDQSLGLPTTGGLLDPDSEAILALQPDLWITSDWTDLDIFRAIQAKSQFALRLHSFASMRQIENNLLEIAQHSRQPAALERAHAFAATWRAKAALIKAVNTAKPKVLLISSCSGLPYAFGQDAYLSDLFIQMGFTVVGNPQRITHLPITPQANPLEKLIGSTLPDFVLLFERNVTEACRLMQLPKQTRLISLDGALFLQPAPTLLQAMETLKNHPTLFEPPNK